ncbi:unnamed protein product [Cyprideis torosa]|uniref:Uncharacterized protein n=1 Tax=Cyprideis torosa TaxID=163714 RepID=A0A7R8ZLX8_9CRUS|nr:unnamed protein product [Cyprideis torosa]CAG0884651.1 unnamed protein product [Cyprideis torosa]
MNMEEKPIEAVYLFPMDDSAAITKFSTLLDGRLIKGVVKTAEEAKEDYQRAITEKKTAFLVEEDKPDVFKVVIGNIPPSSQAIVKISYVTELHVEEESIRFYLPTTIAPRYSPMHEPEAQSNQDKRAAKDLAQLEHSFDSPCPLEISCDIESASAIVSVSSPTHAISTSVSQDGDVKKQKVLLSGRTTDMDRDFVLLIKPHDIHQPRLIIEESWDFGGKSYAAMLTFVPSFKLSPMTAEVIFLVDRSGSMEWGNKIEMAKNALKIFLKSLPTGSYFNIVGFGWHFQALFRSSVPYEEMSVQEAMAYVNSIEADFGGTEILKPLKYIFALPHIEGAARLTSKFTSYVAVDQSQNRVHDAMETRMIANQLPFDWGGHMYAFRGFSGSKSRAGSKSKGVGLARSKSKAGGSKSRAGSKSKGGGPKFKARGKSKASGSKSRAGSKSKGGGSKSRPRDASKSSGSKSASGSKDSSRSSSVSPRSLRFFSAASAVKEALKTKQLEEPRTEAQKFQLIIEAQKFDGSFPTDDIRLLKLFGWKEEKEVEEGAKAFNLAPEVFITLVTLEYLHSQLAAFQEEWKLMVKKTGEWIRQKGGVDEGVRAKIKEQLQKRLSSEKAKD